MTLSEKAAYLKGLMEGMKLDTEKDEGKMIAGIVDLLADMAQTVSDIEETTIAISDELDEMEDDLDAIEDYLMEEIEDDEDDEYSFVDDDDEDFNFLSDGDEMYEVTCPKCGKVTQFDEDTLLSGKSICPGCGESLEFEFDEDDDL